MDLLAKITKTIFEHDLLTAGEKLVIAISGGPDSTALVDLLVEFRDRHCPLNIALACMDHGLWPEAREDIDSISAMAKRYQLEFFWEKIKLLDGGNTAIEERGRELRYRFLERIAKEFGAHKVAVGHHANDQAETLLFRLLKGTGIYGLSAMPYMRPIYLGSSIFLVRPLLESKKNELIAYLDKKGISWWNDPSNYDANYTRNRTRHKIIPFLQDQGYPKLVSTLVHTAKRCREISDYLEHEADRICCDTSNWCPDKPDLREYFLRLEGRNRVCAMTSEKWNAIAPALLPAVMRKIFCKIGAPEVSLRESHYQMVKKNGSTLLPHGVIMWRNVSHIFFILENKIDYLLPRKMALPGYTKVSCYAKIHAKLVDTAVWKQRKTSLLKIGLCAPTSTSLIIRLHQPGDVIRPLGSPGKRKVARILADIKMPHPMRHAVIVVCNERGEILWLPGICIAHSQRITQKSRQVLALSFSRSLQNV